MDERSRRYPVMAKPLIDDDLWALIEPLIPVKPRRYRYPGRKPLPPRQALTGIVFVLKTGIPWEDLPQEMGCGSGMSCWRYLRDWQAQGVWQRLHEVLLARLQGAHCIDWSRAVIDASSVRAVGGGAKTGPNPTDRGRPGTKHHILTDGHGIPLVPAVTAANVNEVTQTLPMVDAIPAVKGQPGRPKHRPGSLYGDRAYASEPHRKALRRRGIRPFLAKRGTSHGSGLGKVRWVVERTLGWLHLPRRLRTRYERRADVHEAFLTLGCILICWSVYHGSFC